MKKTIIYMPLLNEGTRVSRPVIAQRIGKNHYKVLGVENGLSPEHLDEEWLFPIGSCVACELEQGLLVVTKRVDEIDNNNKIPMAFGLLGFCFV
ncbi:MAG: hypothetical protein LBR64_04935 [Dysgonamonadaceae bacterium]|jgi:hypothetical protein|nr:hypothetical protein [Dysgonamonadaceae bacterium]